jgi:hypothetical protein
MRDGGTARNVPWHSASGLGAIRTNWPKFLSSGGLIRLRRPHIERMAQWKASTTRQPPMTKDELRLMLAEAVRNTQPVAEHRPKRSPEAEDDQH